MRDAADRPRARAHALELVLGGSDDASVRAAWQLLEEAGVRSSARHRGTTHRPHVTVLSGPRPGPAVLDLAVSHLAPLLPGRLAVAGLALLGGARRALAELLVADGPTVAARATVQTAWTGSDPRPWVPHLTLAPRLAAAELADAVAALTPTQPAGPADGIPVRVAVGLRWWDPDGGVVHELVPQPS